MTVGTRTFAVFGLGAALGFGAGWCAFARNADAPTPPTVGERATESPGLAGSRADDAGTSTAPPATRDRNAPVDYAALRTASAHELNGALGHMVLSRDVPREAVLLLVQRLDDAVSAKDTKLFETAARLLADSKHPDAVAAFVRLARDEQVDLPKDAGRLFAPLLANARIDGLAAAARRRLEQHSHDRDWITDEWLAIVIGNGNADDIEWAMRASGGSRWLRSFATTTNPTAVPRFREAMRTEADEESLQEHLEAHADAWDWAFGVAEEVLSGRATLPGEGLKEFLVALATRSSAVNRARLTTLLQGIRDDHQKLEALRAADALVRQGVDPSELTGLIQTPRLALDAILRSGEDTWQGIQANTLIYAIEYSRVTWSEDAARTLDALATRPELSHHASHVAGLIRGYLASTWKDG